MAASKLATADSREVNPTLEHGARPAETRRTPALREEREELSLAQSAQYLLAEARTVLPGIQALFGFQLIAVFNASFTEQLTTGEQRLHLLAIGLVALAIALVMSPAAYHRQTSPRAVTDTFIRISTRLLLWSMGPLALSLCLDLYLIGRIILGTAFALILPAALFAVFFILWFLLPRLRPTSSPARKNG